jgi:hypothetical protein
MITLSIYKKSRKQCGDISNLHKAVKTLWQSVDRKMGMVNKLLSEGREKTGFAIQETPFNDRLKEKPSSKKMVSGVGVINAF